MASINSLMGSSSSVSSIYGNKNIISGLASGMDTEAMIENSIAGYKTKIQNIMNDQTKLTWKQDAYRGITDKMIALSEKYTSFRSKTNLASNGFFTKAVKSESNGTYASKIAATGRSSSTVQINGVKKLATAATYRVGVDDLTNLQNVGNLTTGAIDWSAEAVNVSDITGSLTIKVDKQSVSLSFDNEETRNLMEPSDDGKSPAQKLADLINDKLSKAEVGDSEKGSDYLKATVNGDGNIVFEEGGSANSGAAIYFSSASGSIAETLGIKTGTDVSSGNTLTTNGVDFSHKVTTAESLSGKTISVTLDGTTKKITLGDYGKGEDSLTGKKLQDEVMNDIEAGLQDSFGSKVSVDIGEVTVDGKAQTQLQFSTTSKHSTLKISSTAGSTLGMKDDLTNYLNTGSSLEQLLGTHLSNDMALKAVENKITAIDDGSKGTDAANNNYAKDAEDGYWYRVDAEGKRLDDQRYDGNGIKLDKDDPSKGTDAAGNMVAKDETDGNWYRVNKDGEKLYDLTVNGKSVGSFTAKTSMDAVMNAINDSEAGIKVSYSQMTNQFTFTATETGAEGDIDFGTEGLAATLFGKRELNVAGNMLLDGSENKLAVTKDNADGSKETYYIKQEIVDGAAKYYKTNEAGDTTGAELTKEELAEATKMSWKGYTSGQDAELHVTVNGKPLDLTRSSNVVNIDGLSVTLKGTFNDTKSTDELKALSGEDVVTFTSSADADTIVDAVKSFVEQVNDILSSTREAYNTKPSGTYAPLTDEERSEMSESEIKTYEEKAKSGLLFGDRDLSRLYDDLRKAVIGSGTDVGILRDIGITNSYANGATSLDLDEDKLREALAADPDKVRSIFTKRKENGASSDGLMANVSKVLDRYASTKYGDYGLLVKKAGTKTKSLSLMDNTIQKQIDSYEKQIDEWKLKMSDKIDFYTRQFSALEQLINTMNSQSSALSGMMGG